LYQKNLQFYAISCVQDSGDGKNQGKSTG